MSKLQSTRIGTVKEISTFDVINGGSMSDYDGMYVLLDAANGTKYYAWFNVDGNTVDPAVAGRTGIPIPVDTGLDDYFSVAATCETVLEAVSGSPFSVAVIGGGTVVEVTNNTKGEAEDITSAGNINVAVTQQGVTAVQVILKSGSTIY